MLMLTYLKLEVVVISNSKCNSILPHCCTSSLRSPLQLPRLN